MVDLLVFLFAEIWIDDKNFGDEVNNERKQRSIEYCTRTDTFGQVDWENKRLTATV